MSEFFPINLNVVNHKSGVPEVGYRRLKGMLHRIRLAVKTNPCLSLTADESPIGTTRFVQRVPDRR